MNIYEVRPYRDHRNDPSVSIYVLNGEQKHMEKISCIFCKRTVWNMNGMVDKIIMSPMPINDFGIATNIQCKQCHQMYRLLINAK